ncbi:hypothetical protein SAMN04515695_0098 [Pseudovibrio sp. Tun.PSC04-5.I4]|nr:hypothetical protein SAMN04515695_0098 [Pseudovibrio sp. Tun.PSC04-5.I4]
MGPLQLTSNNLAIPDWPTLLGALQRCSKQETLDREIGPNSFKLKRRNLQIDQTLRHNPTMLLQVYTNYKILYA